MTSRMEQLMAQLDRMEHKLDELTRATCRAPRGRTQPVTDDSARNLALGTRHVESVDTKIVFEHWCQIMGKRGNAKLTPERRRLIKARLKDGYEVKDLMRAIEGCAKSDFHMGRGQYRGAKKYNDLTLILRDGSKLEGFREFADASGGTTTDMSAFL